MVGINEALEAAEAAMAVLIDRSEQQGSDQSSTGRQVRCGAGNDNLAKR